PHGLAAAVRRGAFLRRSDARGDRRTRRALAGAPAGHRRAGFPRRRRSRRGAGRMSGTPLAVVGFYEPWYVQVIKAIVIFAVGLPLAPLVLIAERAVLRRP